MGALTGTAKVVMHHARGAYYWQQLLWILRTTLLLVTAMGLGVKWLCMSVRIVVFGTVIALRFIPHLWWYATTPTIIRRVAYRIGDEDVRGVAEYIGALATHQHSASGGGGASCEGESDAGERVVDEDQPPATAAAAARGADALAMSLRLLRHRELEKSPERSCRGPAPAATAGEICESKTTAAAGGAQEQSLTSNGDGGSEGNNVAQRPRSSSSSSSNAGRGATDDDGSDLDELNGTCFDIHSSVLVREALRDVDVLAAYAALPDDTARSSDTSDSPDQQAEEQADHAQVKKCVQGRASPAFGAEEPRTFFQRLVAALPFRRSTSSSSDRSSGKDSKGARASDADRAQNRNNRAFLDIYLPVAIESLFLPRSDTAAEGETTSDAQPKKFPVVICFTGGAWVIGSHFWMSLLGKLLAQRGFIAFTPDYRNFPQAAVDEMVDDVDDAIRWVVMNCERFHGDPGNITVLGQSAGAHLTMLSLLRQATIVASDGRCRAAPSSVQGDAGVGDEYGRKAPGRARRAFRPRYNPRDVVRHYVGLSGFYDLVTMLPHLDSRGLYRRVVFEVCGGEHRVAEFSCVTRIHELVRAVTAADTAAEGDRRGDGGGDGGGVAWASAVVDFLPRRVSFVHGNADESAPHTESVRMKEAIELLQMVSAWCSTRHSSGFGSGEAGGDRYCKGFVASYRPRDEPQLCKPTSPASRGGVSSDEHVDVHLAILDGANHTDPLVEEPLCGVSTVADMLVALPERRSGTSPVPSAGATALSTARHRFGASFFDRTAARALFNDAEQQEVVAMTLPPSRMPLWLRVNRFICPF